MAASPPVLWLLCGARCTEELTRPPGRRVAGSAALRPLSFPLFPAEDELRIDSPGARESRHTREV